MRTWLRANLAWVLLFTACDSPDPDMADTTMAGGTATATTQEPASDVEAVPDEMVAAYLESVGSVSDGAADLIADQADQLVAEEIEQYPNVGDTAIDWSVPDRWVDGYSAYQSIGLTDEEASERAPDIVWGWDPNYVAPEAWDVTLDGCETPTSSPGSEWTWTLSGPDGFQDTVTASRCNISVVVPALGLYEVSLNIETEDGSTISGSRAIPIHDYLIVLMGDSAASGEGNPLPKRTLDGLIWDDPRCHRSRLAGGAQAAQALEEQSPRSSVTFVHLGCSGAQLGEGVLFPYDGQEPPSEVHTPLESQLHQIQRALCRGDSPLECSRNEHRPIDHLIVQVGINELGFSDLILRCVWLPSGKCYAGTDTLFGVKNGLARLETLWLTYNLDQHPLCDEVDCDGVPPLTGYGTILERLRTAGIEVKDTYLVGYPNGLFGGVDGQTTGGCGYFELVNEDEAEWMKQTAIALNEVIRVEALKMGAYPVLDFSADFESHGYCAGEPEEVVVPEHGFDEYHDYSESWFVPVSKSLEFQENMDGSVHPDGDGHARIAASILGAMAAAKVDYTATRRMRVFIEEVRLTEPGVTAELNGDQAVNLTAGGNAVIIDSVTKKPVTLYRTGRNQVAPLMLTPGEWETVDRSISFSIDWSPEFGNIELHFGTSRPSLRSIAAGTAFIGTLSDSEGFFTEDLTDVASNLVSTFEDGLINPDVPPVRPPNAFDDERGFSWNMNIDPQGDGTFESGYFELVIPSQFPVEGGGSLGLRFCLFDDPLPVPSLTLPDTIRCDNLERDAGVIGLAP